MTNFAHGRTAEASAADYLRQHGYSVVERNWRTRQCEIDIVATKSGVAYCIEVKYRQNSAQGSGLEYITASKQKQMGFAAQVWVAQSKWPGETTLGAIEVSGPDYEVTEFIDSIF
jgi:Holliday junction resolvase-like predicted endonuclease